MKQEGFIVSVRSARIRRGKKKRKQGVRNSLLLTLKPYEAVLTHGFMGLFILGL